MLPPSILLLLRKHLPERLDLDAREHAARHVRIAVRKRDRFRLAFHIHNDKTAAAVGEWPRDLHFAGLNQRPQIVEMSRPHLGPQRSAVGSVMADNHEQHRIILLKRIRRNESMLLSTVHPVPQN